MNLSLCGHICEIMSPSEHWQILTNGQQPESYSFPSLTTVNSQQK